MWFIEHWICFLTILKLKCLKVKLGILKNKNYILMYIYLYADVCFKSMQPVTNCFKILKKYMPI